jgi:hypothetical protein
VLDSLDAVDHETVIHPPGATILKNRSVGLRAFDVRPRNAGSRPHRLRPLDVPFDVRQRLTLPWVTPLERPDTSSAERLWPIRTIPET